MPPKVDLNDPEVARIIDLFSKISYTGPKAAETSRNAKHVSAIEAAISKNGLAEKDLDAKRGQLVVNAVTQCGNLSDDKKDFLVAKVVKGDLDNDDRVKTAIKSLAALGDKPVEEKAFDEACGVGVVVTPEQVQSIAETYVEANKDRLQAKGKPNIGTILGALRGLPELRWANSLDIKNAAEAQLNKVWPKGAETPGASGSAPAKAAKAKPAKVS